MRTKEPIIAATIVLAGIILSLHGINWGNLESWNPDDMGLLPIFSNGKLPFQPLDYLKPPFHTYFNYFFAEIPAHLAQKLFGLAHLPNILVLFSRLLTITLFASSIIIFYAISRKIFTQSTTIILAVLYATSAGIIAFTPFLTADIPVLFWMLCVFFFCQRIVLSPRISTYCAAGLLTGVATATKYNALVMVIPILVSHSIVISRNERSLRYKISKFCNVQLCAALAMVVIGFLAANPFAVIDHKRFLADFLYNYRVTQVYGGITTGHSYAKFIYCLTEILGGPVTIICGIALLIVLIKFTLKQIPLITQHTLILSLSIFFVYFLKFGSFPRLETRFVLPVVPYIVLAGGVFFEQLLTYKYARIAISSLLIIYNVVCAGAVGQRFLDDPRMKAQKWMINHVDKKNIVILSSAYTPKWENILDAKNLQMPMIRGRERIFKTVLAHDPVVENSLKLHEGDDDRETWYTAENISGINPEYIAVNSLYFGRFFEEKRVVYYPRIREFVESLLKENFSYSIIFDSSTKPVPIWLYPRNIDFLSNRMVILKRQ